MNAQFAKYKGIHPGAILERELNKRELAQRPFAMALGIAPQSFNQIIKGKRPLPLPTALKIEKALNLEEGTMALLQTHYDIKVQKMKDAIHAAPDLTRLRRNLFWDTDLASIDWQKMYKAVIKRVFERGNADEKQEIVRFYGLDLVKAATGIASPY
jgi:addiction module HigA family antidote